MGHITTIVTSGKRGPGFRSEMCLQYVAMHKERKQLNQPKNRSCTVDLITTGVRHQ